MPQTNNTPAVNTGVQSSHFVSSRKYAMRWIYPYIPHTVWKILNQFNADSLYIVTNRFDASNAD